MFIGKYLAHFPRRDTTKDSIVIDDISHVLVRQKASLVAIAEITEQMWLESNSDKPFATPSGEICKKIMSRTRDFERQYIRFKRRPLAQLEKPKEKEKEPHKNWDQMSGEEREAFKEHVRGFDKNLQPFLIRAVEAPEDMLELNETTNIVI